MKKMFRICTIVFLLAFPGRLSAQGSAPASKYIFFLHNKFLELNELDAVSPEYGRAEYKEVLDKFRQAGFTVISEKRPRDTDVKQYARKVVKQIDSLRKKGVKPGNITVIGTSKGGYIAQYVSTFLKNPDINFVFIGSYQDKDLQELPDIQFCGNILSIYEKSDFYGVSAFKRIETSQCRIPHFKEIELRTNLRHGFLYHPMDEWVKPSIQWAHRDYGVLNKAEIQGEIDSILKSKPDYPFNGVVLIKDAGGIVYSHTEGYADIELKKPLTGNSQFVIGSLSKQFTAALTLLEMEKGRLKLSDAIGRYLPELSQAWRDSVTIYHLLTHTHGITSRTAPLSFTPGTRMDYERGNNIGYQLLSEIVQKTSGKPFSRLSEALFHRCGMKHTFHPEGKKYKQLVNGYTLSEDGIIRPESAGLRVSPAAGGFISTAADLITWNERLHSNRILKPETFSLMTTIQPDVIRQHPLWGRTEYGLGLTVSDKENLLQTGQTGSVPGFISMNFYFPESGTSIVVIQNLVRKTGDSIKESFYYHVRLSEYLREKLKAGGKYWKPDLHPVRRPKTKNN